MEVSLKDVPLLKQRFPGEVLLRVRKDPLALLKQMADLGDCSMLRFGPVPQLFLVNHPELFKEVLVTKSNSFIKGRGVQLTSILLGKGLLTNEFESHRQQRKLVLPAFHHSRLSHYGDIMVQTAAKRHTSWRNNRILEIDNEMMHLTLEIVAGTLFGADVGGKESGNITKALTDGQEAFGKIANPFAEILMRLPLPVTRQIKSSRKTLDATIYRMIDEHRQHPEEYQDLLSMLLAAQDEDTGVSMDDEQVRDEAMTLFAAGHETGAVALTWTWYMLAQHPEIEERLHRELDNVLEGREPTFADIPRLKYTRQVFSEVLRLYPPAWVLNREAIEDVQVGDYHIPRGATVDLSPYILHHDDRFWPDPDTFDPDRFAPENKGKIKKFTYLPFSFGVRGCIGEQFAWTEAILIIATLAQRWKFRLVEKEPVELKPVITLRPARSIPMRVLTRS